MKLLNELVCLTEVAKDNLHSHHNILARRKDALKRDKKLFTEGMGDGLGGLKIPAKRDEAYMLAYKAAKEVLEWHLKDGKWNFG